MTTDHTPAFSALFDGDPWIKVEIPNPPLVLDPEWLEHIAAEVYRWAWDNRASEAPLTEVGAAVVTEARRHRLQAVVTRGPRVLAMR